MLTPVPPQSNQPLPEPPDEPDERDEPDDAHEPNEGDPDAALEAADAGDLEMPPVRRPSPWPAVVRWARLCRVLAFLTLVYFGWNAAWNFYEAITSESQIGPFVRPQLIPAWNLFYALLHTVFAIASCISLLGFAELLHLLMSLEAQMRANRRLFSKTP